MMTNLDLIFQLVERYGKTDPEMSEKYNLSSETKYFQIQDHSMWSGTVEYSIGPVDILAFDPQKKGEEQRLCRPVSDRIDKNEPFIKLWQYHIYESNALLLLQPMVSTLLSNKQLYTLPDEQLLEEINFIRDIAEMGGLMKKRDDSVRVNTIAGKEFFKKICESIKQVINENYDGRLELPAPIVLLNGNRGIEKDSFFLATDAIDTRHGGLNFYIGKYFSDLVTDDRYSIEFLDKINDLVGGKEQSEFLKNLSGELIQIKNSVHMPEDLSPQSALKALVQADGEVRLHYEPYTDYRYTKIRQDKKSGAYIAEYTIYEKDDIFEQPMSVEEAVKFCQEAGIDLITNLKARYQEDIEYNKKRFTYAFNELMPSLYEQTKKEGVQIDNLDALLKWCHDKEKNKRLDKVQERQGVLAQRTEQKVSSPIESIPAHSNSTATSGPNGRGGGRDDR